MSVPSAALRAAAADGDLRARVALANQLLAAGGFGTSEFEEGLALLTAAAEAGDAEAQWYLGCVYVQVLKLPDALVHAAAWFERSVRAGYAPAFARLADLLLTGRGLARDEAHAYRLIAQVAELGYPFAIETQAYLLAQGLGASRDAHAAARLHAQAVALGHPASYLSLGLRFAIGAGIPLDRAFASALLRRAADASYPWAARSGAALQLDARERDAAEAWYARLRANYAAAAPLREAFAAASDPTATGATRQALEAHLASLGHPALRTAADARLDLASGPGSDAAFAPPRLELAQVCGAPRVAKALGFVGVEERARIMAVAEPVLTDPRAYAADQINAEVLLFDGEGARLTAVHAEPVMRQIERRASALAGFPVENLEPFSVARYAEAQQYHPHFDYYTEDQLHENSTRFGDRSGQRVITFLIYLRAADEGGGTHYLHPGLTVEGEDGAAVLHWNCLPNGRLDPDSHHAGLPVVRGEKWLARAAFHAGALSE